MGRYSQRMLRDALSDTAAGASVMSETAVGLSGLKGL